MIISISGTPGSGKSTAGRKLAEKFGYEQYDAGFIRRQAAKERGLTLAELNNWSKNNIEGEKIVDDYLARVYQEGRDNIVAIGRLAFHFIPSSVKIYLYTDPQTGAKRIWSTYQQDQEHRNEDQIKTFDDLLASVQEREQNDAIRYKKHYNLNVADPKNYDLYLDVTDLNEEQEFEAVYNFIINYSEK